MSSWSKVQSTEVNAGGVTTSFPLTFTGSVATGNLLRVKAACYTAASYPGISVADSQGNAYNADAVYQFLSAGTLFVTVKMFTAFASSTGSNTITITTSGHLSFSIAEFSFSGGTPVLDPGTTPTNNGGTNSTNGSTGALTISGNDLVDAIFYVSTVASTYSPSSGFTIGEAGAGGPTLAPWIVTEYWLNATTPSITPGLGFSTSIDWVAVSCAYYLPNSQQSAGTSVFVEAIGDLAPESGRVVTGINRTIPPASQFARTRPCMALPYDLPPENGRVIIARSMTPARQLGPRPSIQPQQQPQVENGRAFYRSGFPIPPGQSAVPVTRIIASAQPLIDGGSVQTRANHRAETPLARKPAIVNPYPLAPDPGSSIHRNGTPVINLRPSPHVIAGCEELAPYRGGIVHIVGPPSPVSQASTPRRAIVCQSEPIIGAGSTYTTHGKPISIPFVYPPRPVIACMSEPVPESGRATSRHGPKAYDVRPGLPTIVTTEAPAEPGHSVTTRNPAPLIVVRPTSKIVRPTELDPESGRAMIESRKPASIARFNRPPAPITVYPQDLPPELGRVVFSTAHVPGFDEEASYVDPDLASLIIVTASDPWDIDPDLASIVTD